MPATTEIFQHAEEFYGDKPDYPFDDSEIAVLRHRENQKWYALFMRIPPEKLGLPPGAHIDVVNLKCDPLMIGDVRNNRNIFPAYHMSKAHWITVIPTRTAPEQLFDLLDLSFQLTKKPVKAPKRKKTQP